MNSTVNQSSDKSDLALVIGATGFIGKHLVEELLQRGYQVRVYSRQDYPTDFIQGFAKSNWFTGAIDDLEALGTACEGVQTVFHLANISHVNHPDPQLLQQVNVIGTGDICDACASAGVKRLVYFSSALAADPGSSLYADSKLAAEKLVLAAGKSESGSLHVTVLRPVNVYGAGMRGNIAGLINRIGKGSMPPLPRLENRLALISVKDLCRAAVAVAEGEHASGRIYTLTDGELYTPSRIEAAVYAALARKKPNWATPRVVFYAAALGAQLANLSGIWKNDMGLRTYRNLVADKPVTCEKIATDLEFFASESLETVMPDILAHLDSP